MPLYTYRVVTGYYISLLQAALACEQQPNRSYKEQVLAAATRTAEKKKRQNAIFGEISPNVRIWGNILGKHR